ncbi:hypothetical protein [Variovorax boronicumulans]
MAWKIERWLAEVFPGKGQIYAEYRALPTRELAIVAAAVLDVALAELLSLRLMHIGNEAEEFLGVNGDGRAPAGSFGARIQLALLVGLLTPEDAAILRTIKELRNLFAHRVRLTFLSPQVLKATTCLAESMRFELEAKRSTQCTPFILQVLLPVSLKAKNSKFPASLASSLIFDPLRDHFPLTSAS